MESKDNRFNDKKSKMKQHYSTHPRKYYQRGGGGGTSGANHTSSSSPQADGGVHSIVDVADSSDEPRFARGKGWSGRKPPTQLNRERLDLTHNERAEDLYANDAAGNDKENAQLCAGNYQQMASHVSHTGHFSFDDEKQWNASLLTGENEQKVIDANEYFTLNFKMLNAGLQSIPFYKRMDYSAALFTREQLSAMNQAAEIVEKNYQQAYGKKPSIQVDNASQRSGNQDKDELDELLELTSEQVNKVSLTGDAGGGGGGGTPNTVALSTPAAAAATSGDTKDDVQNWLDSVLEE